MLHVRILLHKHTRRYCSSMFAPSLGSLQSLHRGCSPLLLHHQCVRAAQATDPASAQTAHILGRFRVLALLPPLGHKQTRRVRGGTDGPQQVSACDAKDLGRLCVVDVLQPLCGDQAALHKSRLSGVASIVRLSAPPQQRVALRHAAQSSA